MPTNPADRPDYFEGQYLGADDLDAAVEYAREQLSRHALGAHTWGIVAGLQLTEKPASGGGSSVDVYLQPGVACDGFGRVIVVTAPYKIAAELFGAVVHDAALDGGDPPGRLFPLWLRYEEMPGAPPRPGFELCAGGGAYARVHETFRIAAGERKAHGDRHDPVTVAGQQVDAQDALQALDPQNPPVLLYDESVAYQAFPDEPRVHWLVPIGAVRWEPHLTAGQPGQFVPRNDPDLLFSRRLRQYAGVVAEEVLAADGMLRLRHRNVAPSTVWSEDRVWVEGDLRVDGDARLFGGRLDLRLVDGTDAGVPMLVRRVEANSLGGRDLQLVVGKETDGDNRFAVGPLDDTGDALEPKFVVTDDGKAGVGVPEPTRPLEIRAQGATEELIGFQDPAGTPTWHVSQKADGRPGLNLGETGVEEGRLFVKVGGNVGIGTTEPEYGLEIRRPVHKGLSVGEGGDAGRIWTEYKNLGPNLIFYDKDDVGGMLRFRESPNSDDEDAPEFEAFIAGRRGKIGIGEEEPEESLHVQGAVRGDQSGALRVSTGQGYVDVGPKTTSQCGLETDRARFYFNKEIRVETGNIGSDDENLSLRTAGTTRMTVREANGFVGINTTSPQSRLHVRDSINESAFDLNDHVAAIENTSTGDNADVLALRVGRSTPGSGNNFLTFFGAGNGIGAIEGDGSGGVSLNTSSADYAEWLPREHGVERLSKGDVVGVRGGRVSRSTRDADQVLVVSSAPIVVGNRPRPGAESDYERIAFLGQVPVRVRGPVRSGDYLAASGLDDGTAVAVRPEELEESSCGQLVGRAWESDEEEDVKLVNTAVGLPDFSVFGRLLGELREEIGRLRGEVGALRSREEVETAPDPMLASGHERGR